VKMTSEGDFYVVPGFTSRVVEDGEQSSENDLLLLEMLALHYENYEDACNSTVSSLIGGSCSFGGGNEFLPVSASLNFDRS
jgi:hypothetical protein